MGQFAAISGTTQLVGGAIQGAGAQKQAERQEQLAQEQRTYEEQQLANQRARYEASVQEFTNQANAGAAAPGAPGQVGQAPAYDPVAEAQAIGARYRAQYEAQNPPTGLVARGMQTPQPMTNGNFPIYNPYYYRG